MGGGDGRKVKEFEMMKKVGAIILSIAIFAVAAVLFSACSSSDVTGITVLDKPEKTIYVVNEELDITGCTIRVNYSNGSSKTLAVTESMVSGFDTSSIGKRSITITYTVGKRAYSTTQEFSTIGRAASRLTIITPPNKTDYVEGQQISLEGIEVEVVYNNGEVETVGASALTSDSVLAYLGQSVAVVRKDNVSVNYDITVSEKAVVGISVLELPRKAHYYEGELFDETGMIIGVVYNDGSSAQLNAGFDIVDSTILVNTEYIVIGYQSYTVNCPITVSPAKAIGYEATVLPKVAYVVGEEIDFSEMELEIEYNNGRFETLKTNQPNWHDLTLISPARPIVFEDNKMTLRYFYGDGEDDFLEISIDITVSVRQLTGFDVIRNRQKTAYIHNEPIELTGLELHAVYNDKSTEVIIYDEALDSDITYDSFALITMTCVTIRYKGLTYQYDITVSAE